MKKLSHAKLIKKMSRIDMEIWALFTQVASATQYEFKTAEAFIKWRKIIRKAEAMGVLIDSMTNCKGHL